MPTSLLTLLAFLLATLPVFATTPPLRPIPPAATSINVKDYGAKGDGKSDDTAAIQQALNEAYSQDQTHRLRIGLARGLSGGSRESAYSEIVFPEGTYLTSETLVSQWSTSLRGIGKATLRQRHPEKDLLYFHQSYRNTVENLRFEGGKVQLRFWTQNNWARIVIDACTFAGASESGVECLSFTERRLKGDQWFRSKPHGPYLLEREGHDAPKLTPVDTSKLHPWANSTLIVIRDSHFLEAARAVHLACDTAFLRNCLFETGPKSRFAPLHLRTVAYLHQIEGKGSDLNTALPAWITTDKGGILSLRGGRFSTLPLIRSSLTPGYISNSLSIDGVHLSGTGTRPPVIIEAETQPEILSVRNLTLENATPLAPVQWESEPDEELLNALRYFKQAKWEPQYKVRVDPPDNATLPPVFEMLPDTAPPAGVREKVAIAPLPWSYRTLEAATGPVIDATSHGVTANTGEDQSDALQKAIDAAAKEENALLLLPGGLLHLSHTLQLPPRLVIRGTGATFLVMKENKLPILSIPDAQEIGLRNLNFLGGSKALSLQSRPEAEARVAISNCSFYDQNENAITALAGNGSIGLSNRLQLLFQDGILHFAPQALVTNATQVELEAFWANNSPHQNDAAYIENRGGAMRMVAMLGNPTLWIGKRGKQQMAANQLEIKAWPYSRNLRWIDNYGSLYALDNRFGGESGGMTPLFHRKAGGTIYLGGGLARYHNEEIKNCIAFLEEPPALALFEDLSGVPVLLNHHSSRLMDNKGDYTDSFEKVFFDGVLPP